MQSCQEVDIRENDKVLEIHINRPERKNALTHAMYTAINDGLAHADEQGSIRVVLITGTQDCFTAGNDLADFLGNPPSAEGSPVMRFLGLISSYRKPLVAAVNGPAVGVGMTMLLHMDLVYLGASARLKMPFTGLGLCPEAGSSFLLPRMLGHQRAAQLLLLGDTLDAHQALAMGLANAVADDDEYLSLARQKAQALAALPPESVRISKSFMRQPHQEALVAHMATEGMEFIRRLGSPEAREAMQAFMQKRAPDFSRFE